MDAMARDLREAEEIAERHRDAAALATKAAEELRRRDQLIADLRQEVTYMHVCMCMLVKLKQRICSWLKTRPPRHRPHHQQQQLGKKIK
jgi:hypothetical protein